MTFGGALFGHRLLVRPRRTESQGSPVLRRSDSLRPAPDMWRADRGFSLRTRLICPSLLTHDPTGSFDFRQSSRREVSPPSTFSLYRSRDDFDTVCLCARSEECALTISSAAHLLLSSRGCSPSAFGAYFERLFFAAVQRCSRCRALLVAPTGQSLTRPPRMSTIECSGVVPFTEYSVTSNPR